jgi:hypothetical protein
MYGISVLFGFQDTFLLRFHYMQYICFDLVLIIFNIIVFASQLHLSYPLFVFLSLKWI